MPKQQLATVISRLAIRSVLATAALIWALPASAQFSFEDLHLDYHEPEAPVDPKGVLGGFEPAESVQPEMEVCVSCVPVDPGGVLGPLVPPAPAPGSAPSIALEHSEGEAPVQFDPYLPGAPVNTDETLDAIMGPQSAAGERGRVAQLKRPEQFILAQAPFDPNETNEEDSDETEAGVASPDEALEATDEAAPPADVFEEMEPVDPVQPDSALGWEPAPAPVDPEPTLETPRSRVSPTDPNSGTSQAEPELESGTLSPQVCTANLSPPYPVRRLFAQYRDSKDFRDCSKAARLLLSQIQALPEAQARNLYHAGYLAEHEHLYDLVNGYSEACLRQLDDVDLAMLLSPAQRQVILERVGLLSDPSNGSFCVGLLAETDVLTAKHCFVDIRGGNFGPVKAPRSDLIFETFAKQRYKLSLDPAQRSWHYRDLSLETLDSDFTLLRAELLPQQTAPATDPIPLRTDLAVQWQQLILVSVQPYLRARAGAAGGHLEVSPSLDVAPTCSILLKDGNYLLHGCQTEAGMSGTPLLAIDANENVVLVGLHTGVTRTLQTACAQRYQTNFPNYGIDLSKLEEISE